MIDVLVAGAGPAGLATALFAARVGLTATVVDPRPGPIDKACGEGLMPGAVRALRDLGVDPPGLDFRGIGYSDGRHRAEALFRSGNGRGVRRTDLQATLLAAVRASGVPVLQRAVSTIDQDAESVTAAGLTARYLVAADGLHSPIARARGLVRPPVASRKPRWGLRRHFEVSPWSDLVQVHWSPAAEAYVTPVAPGLVGVAVLSSHRAPFDDQLGHFPELADRLNGAQAGPVRGAGPLRRHTSTRVDGRVLLVGDAAGYVDALTGEGIAVSLACAKALVQCLITGKPERYESLWLRESRRYRTLTSSLLWASGRPALRRRLVPAAQRVPWAFGAVVGQLAR